MRRCSLVPVYFHKKTGLKLPGSLIFKKQPEIQFFSWETR